jgi:hypothetical protein
MASILNVDQINNAAGTSAITIDSSGNVAIAGHVVQVVKKITNGAAGTTSGTYADSGQYIDITPKFANSLILVSWSALFYVNGAAVGYATVFRTLTGGSAVNMYNNGDYNTNASTQSLLQIYGGHTTYFPGSIRFMDTTHNTTNSIRYSVYLRNSDGAMEVYFPPGSSDATTITAMEIAQ